jgi:hypothetical protein
MSARVRSTLWTRCTRVTMIARFRQTTGRCESGPWTREVGCAREPYLHFCGSPGMSVGHAAARSWGSERLIGPQESMTNASAAVGEWKP